MKTSEPPAIGDLLGASGQNGSLASKTRSDTLANRAYRATRIAIMSGKLEAGRLYSESWLAESLGISRTPARQALHQLAFEDLIEVIPQRGFRIRVITRAESEEHYALREAIETYVVRTLCTRVDDSAIATLEELWEQQVANRTVEVEFIDLDEQFHVVVAEAAGLPRAAEIVASLKGVLWLLGTTVQASQERREAVLREHRALIDAVKARDSEAASQAMAEHLRRSAAHALAAFPEDPK